MEISTINAQTAPVAEPAAKDISSEAAGFSSYMASAADAAEPKMVLDGMGNLVELAVLNGSTGVPYDPYPYTDFTDWFPKLAQEYDFNTLWGTPENLEIVRQLNEHDELGSLPAVERITATTIAPVAAPVAAATPPATTLTPAATVTPTIAPEIIPQTSEAATEADHTSTSPGTVTKYHSQATKSYISDSGTAVLMALLEQEMDKDKD
ncbi:MAG: hypothetical protein LBM98_10320 [Oscillospiraceae bacterium]|jgi:hypothetical protein|nr:hypothetical protein [Oscillospiraceae bacterium]